MDFSSRQFSPGVREFPAEAEEILDELGRNLLTLSESPGDDPSPEIVNAIFRGAHTLKGLAGMLGFTAIGAVAHHLETLLDHLRLGRTALNQEVLALLFETLESLGRMVRTSLDAAPDEDPWIIRRLEEYTAAMTVRSAAVSPRTFLPERIAATLTEYEEHRLEENLRKGRALYLVEASFPLESFDQGLEILTAVLKERGEVISTLPTPGGVTGDGIDFTLLVGSEETPASLPGDARLTALTTRPAAVPAPPRPPEPVRSSRSITDTVRVDIATLDELMALVGELIAAHALLAGVAEEARQSAPAACAPLGKPVVLVGKKLGELQNGLMAVRMVPIRTLYDKMARIVKKIGMEEGREFRLDLVGGETRLDKQIIEDIADPLMHLVRNAVDHGIEPVAERVAAGKEPQGCIVITAGQKGNHVVIEISDDGRGIDRDRIRRRAETLGILPPGDPLSADEIMELIFRPGFSTSDRVSDLSGRGVGMDVVKTNIAAISGTVRVESEAGRGSRVIITIPITLAIIRTLLVDVGDETYGLPVTTVLETVPVSKGDLLTIEGVEVLPVRDGVLPLVRLDRYFGVEAAGGPDRDGFAVVAGMADRRIGIMVDDLRGQQDLVLKSLGELLGGVPGIAGAADLGEGRTILILDVAGIVGDTYRGGATHVS